MICGTGFTSLPKFGQEWEDVEGEHLSIISNTLLQASQHQALSACGRAVLSQAVAWLRMTTIPQAILQPRFHLSAAPGTTPSAYPRAKK